MTITSARLAPGDLDDLASAVHGRVAGPAQPDWEQIRRGWNLSVDVPRVRAALAEVDSGMMPPNFGPLERRNLTDADLARLQAVKASYDPRRTIRSARPIPLPHRAGT